MIQREKHLRNLSRIPMMACAPPPSTTAFLPCLLTIVVAGFQTLLSGIGPLTTVIGSLSNVLVTNTLGLTLAVRQLPWKITGPVF